MGFFGTLANSRAPTGTVSVNSLRYAARADELLESSNRAPPRTTWRSFSHGIWKIAATVNDWSVVSAPAWRRGRVAPQLLYIDSDVGAERRLNPQIYTTAQ